MSLHNEWVRQYRKILKSIVSKPLQQPRCTELFWKWMRLWWLGCATSRTCQWWVSETCGYVMWAWKWEMYLLFPAQMLACFMTAQITGVFTLHTEIAGHRTAWILRHLGTSADLSWTCTFEYLGGASLLEFLAFLCVLAIFVCLPSGRSISMPCETVSETDTEKEDML